MNKVGSVKCFQETSFILFYHNNFKNCHILVEITCLNTWNCRSNLSYNSNTSRAFATNNSSLDNEGKDGWCDSKN